MNNKFLKYIKSRGVFVFTLLTIINFIGLLPFDYFLFDIFSHFKLQYIIFNIIFLGLFLYLSFFNRKFIVCCLISLILICINYADVSQYIGKPNVFESEKFIKIGLFNVFTKNKSYNKLMDLINKNNPDIVILQETDDNWLNNIKEIKKKYPYYFEYTRDDNFGISIYSKFELISPEIEFWSDYDVPVLKTSIKLPKQIINLYCVHTLPPINNNYYKIRNQMLNKISALSNTNTIVAGDFNTTIYSKSYKKFIKSSNFRNCQLLSKKISGSWNAKYFLFLRIPLEQILISNNFRVNKLYYEKSFDSDHLPLFVNLNY